MQLNRTRSGLLALVLASLAACGGAADPAASTKAGNKALASGNYGEAATEFLAATTAIGVDTAHPQFAQAKLGLAKAMAGVDPQKCMDQVTALMSEHADLVDDRVIFDVADRLMQNSHFVAATDLLEKAKAKFPDSEALDKLGKKLADNKDNMDPAALAKLKGLGYL